MAKSRTLAEKRWLKKQGRHIKKMILKAGYTSIYDFWINKAGDEFTRSTLNLIIAGETDTSLTKIRKLAKILKLHPSQLIV